MLGVLNPIAQATQASDDSMSWPAAVALSVFLVSAAAVLIALINRVRC